MASTEFASNEVCHKLLGCIARIPCVLMKELKSSKRRCADYRHLFLVSSHGWENHDRHLEYQAAMTHPAGFNEVINTSLLVFNLLAHICIMLYTSSTTNSASLLSPSLS